VLTPRFRKTHSFKKQSSSDNEDDSSQPTSNAYFNKSALLVRPKTAQQEFDKKASPAHHKNSRRPKSAVSQDYDQYMQVRFHSFLAKKHATSPKRAVRLVNIKGESDRSSSPRTSVAPVVGFHKVAAQVESQPVKENLSEALCEQALSSLQDYLASQSNLSQNRSAHKTILTYLRRCIYSNKPTSSADGNADELSFIPFFKLVSTHEKAALDLRGKYDTRTRKNRQLVEKIANLEKELGELKNRLADQQCVCGCLCSYVPQVATSRLTHSCSPSPGTRPHRKLSKPNEQVVICR